MQDNTEPLGAALDSQPPHWIVGRGGLGRRRERPQEWQVCHALDSHVGFDSPTLHEQK